MFVTKPPTKSKRLTFRRLLVNAIIQDHSIGVVYQLTHTIECIAEATGRPLLALTCGDIGTDEVKMEDQLSKWFRLAEIWGAVMLFDEADVYLEKRLTSDLQRNSLVSGMLPLISLHRPQN